MAITMQLLRLSIELIQVTSATLAKEKDKKKPEDSKKTGDYGSVENGSKANSGGGDEETQKLLSDDTDVPLTPPTTFSSTTLPRILLICHLLLIPIFVAVPLTNKIQSSLFS